MSEASVIYVANADSAEISVFRMEDEEESFRPVATVATAGKVQPLAVRADRRFLYASIRGEPPAIQTFTLDRDGIPQPLAVTPASGQLSYLAVDGAGRNLLGASYHQHHAAVHRIGEDGLPSIKAACRVEPGDNPHAMVTSPDNRRVVIPVLGGNRLAQYRYDDGILTPGEPPALPHGGGPRHCRYSPDGRFLFLVTELSGEAVSYRVSDDGWLEEICSLPLFDGADAPDPIWAAELQITPDGRGLYVSERTGSTLSRVAVDADGGLTLAGRWPTERQPRGFALRPDGRYLAAVGEKSDHLSLYRIADGDGELQVVGRWPVGATPNWVTWIRW